MPKALKALRNKKRYYPFLLVSLVLILSGVYLLSGRTFLTAYKFLIISDSLEHADVIVVLSGGFAGERLEEAITLFKKGYAQKMILTGSLITKDISTADLDLQRISAAGISTEVVHMNREDTSTYDNAVNAANIMSKNGMKKAIVVTSPFHTRRARWIFRKVFSREGLKAIVVPVSQKEEFTDTVKTDSMFEEVVFEYQKLMMYWLRY